MVSFSRALLAIGALAPGAIVADPHCSTPDNLAVGEYYRPTGDGVTGVFNTTRPVYRRSPCPAINTLANHGYLPRDGLNISRSLFVAAIVTHFNLDRALTTFIASLVPSDIFSLDQLSNHNHGEHDMSMVHPDLFFGKDPAWVDPAMVDDMFARVGASNTMDTIYFAKLKKQRMDACYAHNPTCSVGPPMLENISLSQPGLLMRGMGGRNEEWVSVENAWSFLVDEKFPPGFAKASRAITDHDLEVSRDQIRRLYVSAGDWLVHGFAGSSEQIFSNADVSLCLTVKDKSLDARAPLHLTKCEAEKANQRFHLDDDQRFIVEHSKMCVAVSGTLARGPVQIIQAPCGNTTSFKWVYDASGRLKSLQEPTKCLAPRGKAGDEGLMLTDCSQLQTQSFFTQYKPFNATVSRIMSTTTQSLCLGVKSASTGELADIEAAACSTSAPEQKLTLNSNEQLVFQHSGKCVAADAAGTQIVQTTCSQNDSQRWFYDSLGRLRSRGAPQKCIALTSTSVGSGIQLAPCSDSPTQNWFAVDMVGGAGTPA